MALVSSGLGHVARGVEVWMTELARHLPTSVERELWSGGKALKIPGSVCRTVKTMSRDAKLQSAFSWHRRYINEQLSALPRTLLLLRRHKPDLIYCGDPVLAWHLKGTQAMHKTRVVFMNGMRLAPNWAKAFDGVQLIAPTYLEEARAELGENGSEHFFVSPHFVDAQAFRPPTKAERSAARKALSLPDGAFVVLNVGPVGTVSGKRLEWLAKEVSQATPDAILLSAGADEEGAAQVHSSAKAELGARFRPLGPVSREDMQQIYHAADAYALAALAEPFSIAVLEAMACGLPVVHHPFAVTSWITRSGGLAASMESPGQAAWMLKMLATDPTMRPDVGANARREVEMRFIPEVVCAQLADELEAVVKRPLRSRSRK